MTNAPRKINIAKLAAAVAALMIVPAVAMADLSTGDIVGKTEAEVRTLLKEQGYEVKDVEMDGAEFEAEVVLNGEEFEFHIDPQTGKITKIERDD